MDGKLLGFGGESGSGEAKTDPEVFASLKKLADDEVYRQPESDGEMIRGIFPIPLPAVSPTPVAFLVVSQLIPGPVLNQVADIRQGVTELRRLQYLLRPVRVSRYVALGAVTLLVLMSAVWLGMYMAREITTPIRQLAEGTLKVADGDYTIHIDQEGKDEIGFLVQSFNKMTQDLQQSRSQLDFGQSTIVPKKRRVRSQAALYGDHPEECGGRGHFGGCQGQHDDDEPFGRNDLRGGRQGSIGIKIFVYCFREVMGKNLPIL